MRSRLQAAAEGWSEDGTAVDQCKLDTQCGQHAQGPPRDDKATGRLSLLTDCKTVACHTKTVQLGTAR